jgi:hypothetical protein
MQINDYLQPCNASGYSKMLEKAHGRERTWWGPPVIESSVKMH